MATDAEVAPLVHRRLVQRAKSLSAGARLFRPWKLWGDARNRADRRARRAADTNIGVSLRPVAFFQCHHSTGSLTRKAHHSKLQIPNYKSQTILNCQFSMTETIITLIFEFGTLEFICYLVLGIWYFRMAVLSDLLGALFFKCMFCCRVSCSNLDPFPRFFADAVMMG